MSIPIRLPLNPSKVGIFNATRSPHPTVRIAHGANRGPGDFARWPDPFFEKHSKHIIFVALEKGLSGN